MPDTSPNKCPHDDEPNRYWAMISSSLDMLVSAAKRGLAGFVAGFVTACLALMILEILPPDNDLSLSELEQRNYALLLALKIGAGVALLSVVAGKIRVSTYWLWFCAVFGMICFFPFWPHKSGVLPLGTVYVNWQFWERYRLVTLGAHTLIALCIAAVGHWGFSARIRSVSVVPKRRDCSRRSKVK